MTETPKRRNKRRWMRFSLRTVLVLVMLFGSWVRWQLQIVWKRKAALDEVKRTSATFLFAGPRGKQLPVVRRWLGDQPVALAV